MEMMHLEPHGPDTWVGVGPQYPWGGLYGGQIVAQGLRAASYSVDPAYRVHSLHAYFIRRGDQNAPVRYEVDRIRDGRTFATRRVVARQSAGAIFNMSASYQLPEDAPQAQTVEAYSVPSPEAVADASWSAAFERRSVDAEHCPGPGRVAWCKIKQDLPKEPLLHACGLAYISDDLPMDSVLDHHPAYRQDPKTEFWLASLDHAIWFHQPIRADEFHLHQFSCHALGGARGLSIGHVFDAKGIHLATINQEVLLRKRIPEKGAHGRRP